MGCVTKSLDF